MGKPVEAEYTELLLFIQKSRQPDFWLKKAESVLSGQKARYQWQLTMG